MVEKLHAFLFGLGVVTLWGCSANMSASELAGAVGEATIAEEDEVLATCRAIERGDAPGVEGGERRKALAGQVQQDRERRAKALLDAVGLKDVDDKSVSELLGCSESGSSERCAAIVAELSPKIEAIQGGPVLSVVGYSLSAKTPEEATQVGKARLLAEIATLSERFNFAHATVLGLVQVAQLVEGMVDDVAEGFGYFKGFASPLLARVSAELIAVGMDGVLAELENDGHVSPASVAAHACKVYQRIDPASAVTNRVIRRAILRFSGASYGQSSGMVAACRELSKKKGGDPVCKEILENEVGVTIPGLGEDDASLEAALQPLPSEKTAEAVVTEGQKRALEVASQACLDDPSREGACTIDRVARVASVLAGLERFEGESSARFASLEARIDRFEESLSLLHGKVDVLATEVERVDSRVASLGSSLEATRKEVADVRDRVAGAEGVILGALGKATKSSCREHVQKVMRARNELAKELGVGAIDPCPLAGGSGGGTIKVYPTRFPSVSVRHEELCDQRFVTVSAQVTFDQGAFACGASGCLDKAFRELVAGKVARGASLILVGNADATPIMNKRRIRDAWKAKKADAKNAALLPEIPLATENDDELQRLLSMMRAMSVRDELEGGTVILEALGKASNRRGVDVRFVLPDLTLDLATNCQN